MQFLSLMSLLRRAFFLKESILIGMKDWFIELWHLKLFLFQRRQLY